MWSSFGEKKTSVAGVATALCVLGAAHFLRRKFESTTRQKDELEARVHKLEQHIEDIKVGQRRESQVLREHTNGQSRDLALKINELQSSLTSQKPSEINTGAKDMNALSTSVNESLKDLRSGLAKHKTTLDSLQGHKASLDSLQSSQQKLDESVSQNKKDTDSELLELRQILEKLDLKFDRIKQWIVQSMSSMVSRSGGKKKKKKKSSGGVTSGSEAGSYYASSLMSENTPEKNESSRAGSPSGRPAKTRGSTTPPELQLRVPGRPPKSG